MITNLDSLTAEVFDYLDRPELVSKSGLFVQMAEKKLNRLLRTAGGEASTTLAVDSVTNAATLPADYQAWRAVSVGGQPLTSATLDGLRIDYPTARAGIPRMFAIQGRSIYPMPIGGPITLDYYRGVPALVNPTDTNWLIQANPDIYFAAVLAEAFNYARDADGSAKWTSEAANGITDLMGSDWDARWGRGAMQMDGPTP